MGVYIWTDTWLPNKNTIAYYKFDGNLNDSSGNGKNATNSGTVSYITNPNAITLSQSSYLSVNNMPQFNHDWTISVWLKITQTLAGWSVVYTQGTSGTRTIVGVGVKNDRHVLFSFYYDDHPSSSAISLNQWYNVVRTYKYSTREYNCYINSASEISGTLSAQYSVSTTTGTIGTVCTSTSDSNFRWVGNLSEFIIENTARTADQVTDYYNSTKSNYGL